MGSRLHLRQIATHLHQFAIVFCLGSLALTGTLPWENWNCIAIACMYSGTPPIRTHLGPSDVSWLGRCPHFRGRGFTVATTSGSHIPRRQAGVSLVCNCSSANTYYFPLFLSIIICAAKCTLYRLWNPICLINHHVAMCMFNQWYSESCCYYAWNLIVPGPGAHNCHNSHYKTVAKSTWLILLALLSYPPAIMILPLGSRVQVQDDRLVGRSPIFTHFSLSGL